MDVFLTIDVETYTGDYDADVFAGGLGLPYILKTCQDRQFPATFFVEALGATRSGIEPLKRVCDAIQSAGQEVQLHLHPTVAQLEGFAPTDDAMWRYDTETQTRLIRTGLELLAIAGVPSVTAFRAGDLAANTDTLNAMANGGIYMGSNRDLDTKSSIRSRLNDHFPVRNDVSRLGAMLDLPVTSFRSPFPSFDGPYRHCQITALSLREMRTSLHVMQQGGYGAATVLTHPGEFFQKRPGGPIPKRKNCHRLEGLIDFVLKTADMRPRFVSQATAVLNPTTTPPEIFLRTSHSLRRIAMQVAARLIPGL